MGTIWGYDIGEQKFVSIDGRKVIELGNPSALTPEFWEEWHSEIETETLLCLLEKVGAEPRLLEPPSHPRHRP
jgi:hypothetical protein